MYQKPKCIFFAVVEMQYRCRTLQCKLKINLNLPVDNYTYHYAVQFQIKSESSQGKGDDTAMNGLMLVCENGKNIWSSVGPWGSWNERSKYCSGGYTKVAVRVEEKQVKDQIRM